jgi:hypothetical protein
MIDFNEEKMNEIKPKKIHSGHIELAVVELLNFRVYTIVPNISHGLLGRHEADLLCYKDGRFTEVEIKISASDLKADFKKKHGHRHPYISRLVYAMPLDLCHKYKDLIPKECGIISIQWNGWLDKYVAHWFRQARHQIHNAIPQQTIIDFMRLGCMRICSLKSRLFSKPIS